MTLRTAFLVPVLAAACLAQDGLFQAAKVGTVRLAFTRDQWRGLTPSGSPNGMNIGQGEWLQGAPGKRNGLASAMGIEFKSVHAGLTIEDRVFPDVAVRYKGNGTYLEGAGAGKFSYKIDFNQYVKGQNIGGATKLNLHSNITDPSWMNEPLSYQLYRDAGVPAPRTAYARVYLAVAGEFQNRYAGLYSLVENVDDHFTARVFSNKGGALFKPVSTDLFRYLASVRK